MSVVSQLLSRTGLAGLLGMQFGGKRDLYMIFGYRKTLTFDDFYAKYMRQDVAKRIVNAPASATWRNPPELKGSEALVKAWKEVVEQHKLWGQIERADRLAGLGYYAIIVLGFDDGKDLSKPVKKGTNKLLYIQPYTQKAATIFSLDDDVQSPRYGLPKMYKIKVDDPLATMGTFTGNQVVKTKPLADLMVHYSRVVHIAEELCESNFLGTPRLQAVYNNLDDLLKVAGGTAETYWMTSNRGMQIDIDKEADLSADDAEALSDEVEEYQHEQRRFLRTKGVKVTPLGGQTPDPKNSFSMIISLISGATGIPQRVLTGSEAGQLASDQDRANWSDRIKERRVTFAEPNVLNPIITTLMAAGVLPEEPLEKFSYEWPPNFQLTPLEEAQTMAQRARAIINLAKHFQDGTPLCSIEEARQIVNLPPVPSLGKIPAPVEVPPKEGKVPPGKGDKEGETDHQPNDF